MNAPRSAARPARADLVAKFQPARGRAAHEIAVADTTLVADPAGALYWPDERLLAVPICIWKKDRLLRRAARCCRPTTPRPPSRDWRG